jgi:hypothetical protein
VSCNQADLTSEFPGLSDTRGWKKRVGADFTRETTVQDAEQIRCLQERPDAIGDQDLTLLPPPIQALLGGDDRQILDLQRLRLDLPDGELRFPRLVAAAADFWTARVDRAVPSVRLPQVVRAFLAIAPLPDAEAQQLAANLGFLLEQQSDFSQLDDTVFFSTFVRFFARYCSVHDLLATLREITAVPDDDLWTFGANCFDGINLDRRARFKNWFSPSFDKGVASEILSTYDDEAWVVFPAKTPGTFNLFYCDSQKEVQHLRIIHDALADKGRNWAAPMKEAPGFVWAPTLASMLTGALSLTWIDGSRTTRQPGRPRCVDASAIINRKPPPPRPPPPTDIDSQPVEPFKSFFLGPDSQFQFSQVDTPGLFDSQPFFPDDQSKG